MLIINLASGLLYKPEQKWRKVYDEQIKGKNEENGRTDSEQTKRRQLEHDGYRKWLIVKQIHRHTESSTKKFENQKSICRTESKYDDNNTATYSTERHSQRPEWFVTGIQQINSNRWYEHIQRQALNATCQNCWDKAEVTKKQISEKNT